MAKDNNKTTVTLQDPIADLQVGKIDAIREILFGSQIKDYETRFLELTEIQKDQTDIFKNQLDQIRRQMMEKIEDAKAELSRLVWENHEIHQKAIERLQSENTNQEDLGKLLIQIGRQLIKKENAD